MPKVVLYMRVSSDEQARKDFSLPAQRKALLAYVAQQGPDWEVIGEWADEGVSAYGPVLKRVGFLDMVSFAKKHLPDFVLVHRFCRFARDQSDSIHYKADLKARGIVVRSITEQVDPDTKEGFLYERLIEVFNQYSSMNLSFETMKGMREKASRGEINGGKVPFGYKLAQVTDAKGRERNVLALGDDDEIATVREIFDMAVNQNMGAKAIANALNSRGVRGPLGRQWGKPTVWFILTNEVYMGDLVWGKTKKVGRDGRAPTTPEERVYVRDAFPAIIDRETFEKRKEIAGERAFEERKARKQRVNYLLARLIRCAHCGATFCGRRQQYKTRKGVPAERTAYYCGGYLNKGTTVCRSLPIDRDWIEGQVLLHLRERLSNPKVQEALREEIRARNEATRAKVSGDAKTLKQKIAGIEGQIDRYFRLIGQGYEVDRAKAIIDELKGKKMRVEAEIAQAQQAEFAERNTAAGVATLERMTQLLVEDFERASFGQQRALIEAFLDEIVVEDHAHVTMRFHVPYQGGLKALDEEEAPLKAPNADEADTTGFSGEVSGCRRGLEWLPAHDQTDAEIESLQHLPRLARLLLPHLRPAWA